MVVGCGGRESRRKEEMVVAMMMWRVEMGRGGGATGISSVEEEIDVGKLGKK